MYNKRATAAAGSKRSSSGHETSVMECDVCVIGSGPSAQSLIQAAVAGGRSILVLEAGRPGMSDTRLQHAIAPVDGPQRSVAPDPSGQVSFRLGGSLNLPSIAIHPTDARRTGVRVARFDECDFAPRVAGPGWPIRLGELEDHYRAAEESLGIGPDAWRPMPGATDRHCTHPFLVVDREPIARGDFADRQTSVAVVYDAPVHRVEIDDCGMIEAAVALRPDGSRLEVRARDFVLACGTYSATRILLESAWSGGVHAANSSGLLGVGLTDHPQLHVGVVSLASPSDWSRFSTLAPQPFGAHARWDALVTRPTMNTTGLAGIVLPRQSQHRAEPKNRNRGIHAAQTLADGLRSRPFTKATLLATVPVARNMPDLVHLALDRRRTLSRPWSMEFGWWGDLPPHDRPSTFSVFALAEQLPDEANRVELSHVETTVGWRRLKVSWNWSAGDRRRSNEAAAALLDIVGSMGGRIEPTPMEDHVHKFSSHHPAGTARMSASPTDGVVDSVGRTHDHPNLWVVGAATFPSNGFATPTLTVMAMAHRTGMALAGRLEADQVP